MNALLIYPEFPDTFWSFRHALKFIGKKSAFPPLGLLTISAMLPRSWNRRLVDMNVRPLTAADLKWADVVLASAFFGADSRFCAGGTRPIQRHGHTVLARLPIQL